MLDCSSQPIAQAIYSKVFFNLSSINFPINGSGTILLLAALIIPNIANTNIPIEKIGKIKKEKKPKKLRIATKIAERMLNAIAKTNPTIINPNDWRRWYAPKDIIAGDFYWFEKHENRSWFAVADCTGHGVPGAMVSVLCINALHQSLTENHNQTTGELLDQVREIVVRTLTKEARSVKDGMDISLACYNHQTKTLQWTGANNPLWVFRGDEILITNPDKQPVGQFDGAKPFTTHELLLEANDWVILFSDGFADQFGGPKNKKYKYAPLKEFIQTNTNKSGSELKQNLKNEFENWKGSNEQTDDVCIIGVRF